MTNINTNTTTSTKTADLMARISARVAARKEQDTGSTSMPKADPAEGYVGQNPGQRSMHCFEPFSHKS
jgi:hypothetical protein